MLICTKCEKEKPETDFHRRLDGYQSRCKECVSLWYSGHYKNNPEYRQKKLVRHHERNTQELGYNEKNNARFREYYKDDPDYYRAKNYRRKYKITIIEYNEVYTQQGGKCAMCGYVPDKIFLAVDHDHSHHEKEDFACKECIRGLLCAVCNRHVLPMLEKHPHLQSDFVKAYLNSRPFIGLV